MRAAALACLTITLLTGSLGLPAIAPTDVGPSTPPLPGGTSGPSEAAPEPTLPARVQRFERIAGSLAGGLALGLGVDSDRIGPGTSLTARGEQCTANFVFRSGTATLLGTAAHCVAGGNNSTDGCEAGIEPYAPGTAVTIRGASQPGRLVYSSWWTMQSVEESDADACAANDFALVRVDAADAHRVDAAVPGFGGPTGTGGMPAVGDPVYSFQNSALRFGLAALAPKEGIALGAEDGGWGLRAYTVSPGVPGDSGSGLLDDDGRAVGVLSTVGLLPYPASNRYTALQPALSYAAAHGTSATLVTGTPFAGGTLL